MLNTFGIVFLVPRLEKIHRFVDQFQLKKKINYSTICYSCSFFTLLNYVNKIIVPRGNFNLQQGKKTRGRKFIARVKKFLWKKKDRSSIGTADSKVRSALHNFSSTRVSGNSFGVANRRNTAE